MFSFFCPCPKGLEITLYNELQTLANSKHNISQIKSSSGGVAFNGDISSCYAVNLYSRIASRVLLHIKTAHYKTEEDIYNLARKQAWYNYFSAHQTMRLDINAHHSQVKSLNFVNLKVKDAICDAFRDKYGQRPSIDTENPQVRIMTFLDKISCHLYIDTSGEALFRRGWRQQIGEAPIKENLAAGILYLSNWKIDTPLLDPMCGSGTFLIEALHMALNVPPGANRNFAIEKLKLHNPTAWQPLKVIANKNRQNALTSEITYISGSDISDKMLSLSHENAARAGVKLNIKIGDVRNIEKPHEIGTLIVNPPYGERISVRGQTPRVFVRNANNNHDVQQNMANTNNDISTNIEKIIPKDGPISEEDKSFYIEWAANLKKNFTNWQVCILSADLALPQHLRLKPKRKIELYNGNLDCRLFIFDMIQGSMRN